MRVIIATFAGLMALVAVSARAAPLAPAKEILTEVSAGPTIELLRQGGACGWGWHPRPRLRPLGRWHWGRCVPNW